MVNGLNIEGVCVNKKCLNFNRPIIFPLGMGEYDVIQLMKGFKCTTCPYK